MSKTKKIVPNVLFFFPILLTGAFLIDIPTTLKFFGYLSFSSAIAPTAIIIGCYLLCIILLLLLD